MEGALLVLLGESSIPLACCQQPKIPNFAFDEMNTLTPSTRRLRNANSRIIILAAFLLNAQPAIPVSLAKNIVGFEVRFESESSALSEHAAQELSRQSPCVKALFLEVAFIKTSGDNAPSSLDGIAQTNLAAARANVLRRALLDLVFPDDRIHTQAEATATTSTAGTPAGSPSGGKARIEYVGTCRTAAAGKPECDQLCKPRRAD